MHITRDRKIKKLWLSQEGYIEKVLKRLNIDKTKPLTITLGGHFKFSKELGAKINKEKVEMENVHYSSAIRSFMYAMESTRPDITYVVRVVSGFMSNPRKEHWQAVK